MSLDPAYAAAGRAAWRAYNDSPMQQRLRREAPVWVGAVYWNPQQDTAEQLRRELTRMRQAGFTFVRFHAIDAIESATGEWDFSYPRLRLDLAHEAGLAVYPHFAFHKPSATTLQQQGLTSATGLTWEDPRVAAAIRARAGRIITAFKDHPALAAWPLQGEPPATGVALRTDADKARFLDWLQERYASPAQVHHAWLIYPDVRRDRPTEVGKDVLTIDSWDDAVAMASAIKPREPGAQLSTTGLSRHLLFGANRDLIRFRADQTEAFERWLVGVVREFDPVHPVLYGNHQLLYANGELGWDQHRCGRTADAHFSSIHLSWHFEPVQGEYILPHYLQARLTQDIFKGGHTNCYETTGGPVQYSGGYGNHMDAPLMRQLMCQFLAAGNQGAAFWDWIPRPGGIEAGEYGLVTLSGRVSSWALECGRVARAMERHRQELWNWELDPELAIVRSWDTEAVMTSEPKRFDLEDGPTPWSRGPSQQHVRAWIGAARAAVDQQVEFQFLTTDEIAAGLAGAYPAIYLPHVRCLDDATLAHLLAYVEAGGRVIADVQCGFEDQWGKVRRQGEGTPMERLFGAWIDAIGDTQSRPIQVDGIAVQGFFGELVTTTARILRRFDHGQPAVSEAMVGKGLATLIAFDPARMCWKPGQTRLEALLGDLYRGPAARRWSCDAGLCYRRRHRDADHYFIVNDGPARSAVLRTWDAWYRTVEDVLDGGGADWTGTIAVDVAAYGAKWLRCTRH